jgi:hypothetical protein
MKKDEEGRPVPERRHSLMPIASGLLFLLLLPGCKDENPVGPGSDIVFPSSNVSYAQHVQPLFNVTCALAGCHDNGPHPSQLRLTSYFQTVFEIPGIVVAGEPQSSRLVYRIEGSVGPQMPLNGTPLTQNQIDGIRTWIVEGALEEPPSQTDR